MWICDHHTYHMDNSMWTHEHHTYHMVSSIRTRDQGRTDNSWGPRAIGDHGAPVSLPKLKKAYEKGTRGISWGPLLTPGPRAVDT
ncbi:unnamed protein product [Staurois parvus]|uniref:Uncharacterized protein n=1 Tax=Staurois parvus TaxID=386267 RepID=A0ABN9D8E5_9NEOB|nr:unnamed protein product [Staurois parvus]